MSEQQADIAPPESYEAGMMADVRAAFEEVSKPAEPVAEQTSEPVVQDKAPDKVSEAKADHPTDERRYADGTFKKTAEDTPAAKFISDPDTGVHRPSADQQPDVTQQPVVQGAPPPGWSVKSKAEWDRLPDHIRADIVKREQEVSSGFAQYAGMKELQPYVEMARSRGQTLKSALDHYTGIERMLAQNPIQGLLQIASNIGYAPQRLAMELSSMLGQPNGQQSPQAFQQPGQQVDPQLLQILSPLLNPLQQEVYGLKSLLQQQAQAAQTREVGTINSAIDRFKADPANRYFDNVEPQIVKLFEGGVIPRTGDHMADLRAAYDIACRMHPDIYEALFNERVGKAETDRKAQEREAAEKAKQASRSITGSPSAGGKDADANDDDSIEDTVRKAYRAHAA